jgi:uncharacterized protein
MKLKVSTVTPEGIEVDFVLPAKEIVETLPANDPIRQSIQNPLSVACHAEKSGHTVALTANYSINLSSTCDRCLEAYSNPFSNRLKITCVARHKTDADEDEGVAVYDGDEINLSEILRDHLFADLPMKFLCKPDCKGLCDKCGLSLNQLECRCDQPQNLL